MQYEITLDDAFGMAESPIEQDVLVDLSTNWGAVFVKASLRDFRLAIDEVSKRSPGHFPIVVAPQAWAGKYRLDALLGRKGEALVALECDGAEFHNTHDWQMERDRKRDAEIGAKGISVERLSGSQIFNHLTWEMSKILFRHSLIDLLTQVYKCQQCHRSGFCPRDLSVGLGCESIYGDARQRIDEPEGDPRFADALEAARNGWAKYKPPGLNKPRHSWR